MKVLINKNELNKILKKLNNVIVSNNKMKPYHSYLLIEATEKEINFYANNEYFSAKCTLAENIDVLEEGEVIVKGKIFSELINGIKEDIIIIQEKDQTLLVKTKKTNINLNTIDKKEFPRIRFNQNVDLKEFDELKIQHSLLTKGLKKIAHAVSTFRESTRKFNGVNFNGSNGKQIFLEASDSYKLSVYEIKQKTDPFNFIVETNLLSFINSFNPEGGDLISIFFRKEHKDDLSTELLIKLDNFLINYTSINESFPRVMQLFDFEPETKVTIQKNELKDALQRILTLAQNERFFLCDMQVTNSHLKINSNVQNIGASLEEVTCLKFEGHKLNIAVNALSLLEHIDSFDTDEIELYFQGSNKYFLISSNNEPELKEILVPSK
ncbi:DNA polymerase III subunit beta [Mycoplasmoides pneumoniae]|uniref:DNA polymerase III subunit beta n=3 Tax=Mycoplasmoides pneumoniae TaxID=2104 RepID=A0AAX0SSD5_MYCPM|nr:DNA polymerase III subunit beta [Mycoplasmoides pneumoniae]ADK87144.1 DNA polymerase III, beta subunit [Mycoplasmoides pneumoniae FH]ALA30849.1 DNA polymerase III subunit beta [Mycoplasmoides pneumoniae 19294]ALA31286.1 DNA polymerase III subunit beta [Mycoplasmoides pneumoniae 39443]ALA35518.1 DNA polymerase III subunit beta [Mycoplasmoides pneumoniae FH]ALA36224.1 DNA polymerase III subunit beta [Mycoplasmoides pneumoniae M1139]